MTTTSRAFSLLELLIVIFIIGLGASLVVPRLVRRAPSNEWTTIHDELNNMLYFARQEAVTSQKVHRLAFDKRGRVITVEVDDGESKPGVRKYTPAYSFYFTSRYELPEGISLQSVKLGKKQLFDEHKGMGWCYVVPHGLVQAIEVNIARVENDEQTVRTFKVAPFLGTFEVGGQA